MEFLNRDFDFQGHRGCRGLMPENTIPGFLNALDLGVKTLETDVVVTKDNVVICSHEPWFSHEISLTPTGSPLAEAEAKNHSIYAMTFAETQKYDVGLKTHGRFPNQKKIAAAKPSLEEMIRVCDQYAQTTSRPLPVYNIEIKSEVEHDAVFQPPPPVFSDLVMDVIVKMGIENRVIVQSFDVRILQYFHQNFEAIQLGLLIENKQKPALNIDILGFIPSYYNPEYILVNHNLIAFCNDLHMKVIPWTVNDLKTMQQLIGMGVDGLISDYPQLFNQLIVN